MELKVKPLPSMHPPLRLAPQPPFMSAASMEELLINMATSLANTPQMCSTHLAPNPSAALMFAVPMEELIIMAPLLVKILLEDNMALAANMFPVGTQDLE